MDKGFNKIQLKNEKSGGTDSEKRSTVNNKKNDYVYMKKRKEKTITKKIFKIFLIIFLTCLFISVVLFFPVKRLYNETNKTIETAKLISSALKNQNIEEVNRGLDKLENQLSETKKAYSFFAFTKFIPIAGEYYKDGDRIIKAGEAGIKAGQIAVEALIPYADLLGFEGKSTFIAGSADERIQTAVATFDKLTPKLGEISVQIEVIKNNLNEIEVNRYPNKIGDKDIKNKLSLLKNNINEVSTLFINARPLLENLPNLLGQPKPKKYLVLFQNDKELRPTGGFITAYAVFRVDRGKIIVESSDDIYKLDEKNPTKTSPPKQFINHLKVYQLHLRDVNYDPDFKDSMQRFEEIYNKIPGTNPVDGIVAVDTHVLVEAMRILGPIPAYGTNFTIDNDPRCDCPSVIYNLEEYAGRRVGYIREERKDIIGVLLYQIMQKALGVSPSQYWGRLFQMMISEFNQKHILVYLHDEKSQRSLENLNFAGRMLEETVEDYLHINDANLGGAKSNMFVKHYIKQEYEKTQDGSIIKTLTIDYKNPREGSKGCNLEAGGLCLNGLMPNWIRIYVPKGSELINFEGSEDPPTILEAYNKTVFEGFLTVKPNSVATIKVRYKLPSVLSNKEKISLYMQKQAGTEGHEVTIRINGEDINLFNLTTDQKIEIKL